MLLLLLLFRHRCSAALPLPLAHPASSFATCCSSSGRRWVSVA
jgi:hypothetical protein